MTMTYPAGDRICMVNCGLPSEECACHRAMMDRKFPASKAIADLDAQEVPK